MKRTALLLMILLLLCPAAQADLFIDLAPGGVTVLPLEGAPFRTEPDARAEPLFNIGPGVNLTLLSVDRETNWAYVLLVVTTHAISSGQIGSRYSSRPHVVNLLRQPK